MKQTIRVTTKDNGVYTIYEATQPHFFNAGTYCATFAINGRREGNGYRSEFVFWERRVVCIESIDVDQLHNVAATEEE